MVKDTCNKTTTNGNKCKRSASPGQKTCWQHSSKKKSQVKKSQLRCIKSSNKIDMWFQNGKRIPELTALKLLVKPNCPCKNKPSPKQARRIQPKIMSPKQARRIQPILMSPKQAQKIQPILISPKQAQKILVNIPSGTKGQQSFAAALDMLEKKYSAIKDTDDDVIIFERRPGKKRAKIRLTTE